MERGSPSAFCLFYMYFLNLYALISKYKYIMCNRDLVRIQQKLHM